MASKKTVTPDNLATLGVERPAVILVDLADADAEIKRRLRLELAVLSAVASLAKQDDGQHVAQAACRMPSAMRAAVANLERRVAGGNRLVVTTPATEQITGFAGSVRLHGGNLLTQTV